jgi:hypothetical protein
MNTIAALNHYRQSLVRDELSVAILADIYRYGPKSEDEISSSLQAPIPDVRNKLTASFRSKLLQFTTDSKWVLTDFAESILAKLGITTATASSLLSEQNLPKSDFTFLNACLEFTAKDDEVYSRSQPFFLHCMSRFADLSGDNAQWSKDENRRLMYGVVFGLNPQTHALGEEIYCKEIIDALRRSRKPIYERSSSEIFASCQQAVHDVKSSNRLFLSGHSSKPESDNTIFYFSWARALRALATQECDQGLQAGAQIRGFAIERLFHTLAQWNPTIEEDSLAVLKMLGKDKGASELPSLLAMCPHHSETPISQRSEDSADAPGSTSNAEASSLFNVWLYELGRLHSDILTGKLNRLSVEQMDKLATQLKNAQNALLYRGEISEQETGPDVPKRESGPYIPNHSQRETECAQR